MKRLVMTAVVAALTLTSCGTKNIHKLAGDMAVEHGFEKSKWQDTDDIYFVVAVGEHADEMEAYHMAMAEASLLISSKSEAITDAALKFAAEKNLIDRKGSKQYEALRTVLNKSIVGNMKVIKDKLFFNKDQEVYKQRVVVQVAIEDIISQASRELASN